MDRNELIKTIEILRTQPKDEKGFSFRRTIKTLQDAKKLQIIEEYRNQLINATGVIKNADQ